MAAYNSSMLQRGAMIRSAQHGRQYLSVSKVFLVALAAVGLVSSSRAQQQVFDPPITIPLSASPPMSFAVGDVNDDFLAFDLVIGHAGAPGLRLNDGTGHFSPEVSIATDTSGSTVALSDLTEDGRPELFVGSSLTGLLYVARWEPGGNFGPASAYPLGVTTSNLNTLHVDAFMGRVLAVTAGEVGGLGGEARVFNSLGDGTLELAGVITPAQPTDRIVSGRVGDLNGDAYSDVVLQTDSGTTSPVHTVSAHIGQSNGTFLPTWSLGDASLGSLGNLGSGMGAGQLLLTLGSSQGVPVIAAHLSVGDGTFITASVSEISTTDGVSVCRPSDVDRDYLADLILIRQLPAEVWLMRGDGLGGFETRQKLTLAPGAPTLEAAFGLPGDYNAGLGGGPLNYDVAVPVGLGTATPSVKACFNRLYDTNVLTDLGHQLKGTNWPIQIVEGNFVAGQPFSFRLSGAVPSGSAFLVVGLALLQAPFKGGTMVPDPFLITGPLPVSAGGELTLSGAAWPGGPSGFMLALQFWFADPAGPAGVAASSGVRITLP